jgi:hypothetical protein
VQAIGGAHHHQRPYSEQLEAKAREPAAQQMAGLVDRESEKGGDRNENSYQRSAGKGCANLSEERPDFHHPDVDSLEPPV